MFLRTAVVVLLVILAVVFVVVRFGEKEAAERAEIGDLAWMVGYWRGEKDGVRMEELWLSPAGGRMVGLHRDVSDDGDVSWEYLRIEAGRKGMEYIAAPEGRGETRFRLSELGGKRALFENRGHDFPRKIVYWVDHRGLHARIEGEGEGEARHEEWLWHRSRIGQRW